MGAGGMIHNKRQLLTSGEDTESEGPRTVQDQPGSAHKGPRRSMKHQMQNPRPEEPY